ncbi:MAG: hypothetical protein D6729_06840 [Deltaproteobacteria bacterium]|nr:MAG: hypothetical protein D6729_06840 [Deltaproteobacteria bacterium]
MNMRPYPSLLLLPLLAALSACNCGGPTDPCEGVRCAAGERCRAGRCEPEGRDGGADGGSGCASQAECTDPTAPICDTEQGICRACASDEECGQGQVCEADGRCTDAPAACISDADCKSASAPYCDTVTAECVACLSNEHCAGFGQVCEAGSCVTPTTCNDDAQCTDPARPRCDPAGGTCVACLEDTDCDVAARQTCDTATHVCVDFVPCQDDSDCDGDPGGPVCRVETGECVACLEDADCIVGTGRVCDPSTFTCTGGTRCVTDAGCQGLPTGRCDDRLQLCVECLSSADCKPVGSTCDLAARRCRPPVACTSDAECAATPETPVCDPGTGYCVECVADGDCANPEAVCAGGVCDAGPPSGGRPGSPCASYSDCEAASVHPPDQFRYFCLEPGDVGLPWQWYQGYCIGLCDTDADCPAGSKCLGGGCWDQCDTDADCRAGYACTPLQAGGVVEDLCAPRCDPALAAGIACTRDADCGMGVCDPSAGHCTCSPVGGPCQGLGYCDPEADCILEEDAQGNPTGFDGGYCIRFDCDPPAKPCPVGSSCYNLGTNTACLPDCDPNALDSCDRAPYTCSEVLRYVLGGACSSDADCPASAPSCYGAAAGTPGTCIRPCASDGDCDRSQGHVCTGIQQQLYLCADPFQGGVCLPGCANDAECGACNSDPDCQAGEVCDQGVCRRPCSSVAQCNAGEACGGGYCGAPCANDADCARGAQCVQGACHEPRRLCDPVARRCDLVCGEDLDCDRSRRCDPASGRCESTCSDATADCGPAGYCDAASMVCAADCRVLPDLCSAGEYCDLDSGACLERCPPFGNGTCPQGKVCDILTGACVPPCADLSRPCSSSTECGMNERCVNGACAPACSTDDECGPGLSCWAGACGVCDWPRWRCDKDGTGLCFNCYDDTHCPSTQYCDVGGSYECVDRCGGVNGGSGTCPPGTLCDVQAGGRCVAPCASNGDCSDPARPICDTASGLCGECSQDADCSDPARPVCDPATLQCVACLGDADCADPTPACDTQAYRCVECTDASHCAGHPAGPLCDTTAQRCVECLADGDCPPERPTCDPKALVCQGCMSDADCVQGGICHLVLGECRPPCGDVPGSVEDRPTVTGTPTTCEDAAGQPATFTLVRAADGVYALSPSGAVTATLTLQGFPLVVPATATVTGVEVEVVAGTDAPPGDDQWTVSAVLVRPGGAQSQGRSAPATLTEVDARQVIGGPTDLWGVADFTPAELSDPNFGVTVTVAEGGGAPDVRARIDEVVLRVHYTEPGATVCTDLDPTLSCNGTTNQCE